MAEFKVLDEQGFRAKASTGEGQRILSARFDRRRRRLTLRLATGLDLAFDPRRIDGLEEASDDDLADVGVEGTGSTLHFRRIDADYGVDRLLELLLRLDPAAA